MCQMLPNNADLRSHMPSDVFRKLEQRMVDLKSALRSWLTVHEPDKNPISYADQIFRNVAGLVVSKYLEIMISR